MERKGIASFRADNDQTASPRKPVVVVVKTMLRNTKRVIFLRFRLMNDLYKLLIKFRPIPAVYLIIKMQIISAAAEKATKPNSMSVPGFCNALCYIYIKLNYFLLFIRIPFIVEFNN